MLFKRPVLDAIARGEVTLAFRRWRRPTVRPGGTLLTAIGVLRVLSIAPVQLSDLTVADAHAAGHESVERLRQSLRDAPDAPLYRIHLEWAGPDPRVALRNQACPNDEEMAHLQERLLRMDRGAAGGPWTDRLLLAIAAHPGMPAGDLAAHCGVDKEWLKRSVRRLKSLGLTESLNPGYRLSKRGAAFLETTQRSAPQPANETSTRRP